LLHTDLHLVTRAYIPLDIDVSPFDNGQTKKEGDPGPIRAVTGLRLFSPIWATQGMRSPPPCAKGNNIAKKRRPNFSKSVSPAQRIRPDARFLVRLDSGNDSTDNLDIGGERAADFLIQRNLRREKPEDWLARAKKEGAAAKEREGKTVYQGACQLSPRAGHDPVRVVYQVVERTITARGPVLLLPDVDVEVATYWTSLQEDPADILPWDPDHGTMEQYQSEYKTDRNWERLPSAKFATNALILQIAMLVFNILRILGQATPHDAAVPLRAVRQRRRLRTVIQTLIICAAKFVSHARQHWVRYAPHNPWGIVLGHLYARFT
jgi:hypothetical protein